uniref:Nuclear receptor n=1 Tax=Panagrellus redivivus TaxID=6233 RepID=A0A7E4WCA0_PANRE
MRQCGLHPSALWVIVEARGRRTNRPIQPFVSNDFSSNFPSTTASTNQVHSMLVPPAGEMTLYETNNNVFSDLLDLQEYMIPLYSSSSGESSSEFEPSFTPLDIKCELLDSPESEPEEAIKKKSNSTVPPDTCLVCGEPTKCCHYDVPSCSGCKTFFRRSVISPKTYTCKNNGKCNIKAKERCRQCRFDQCILVGMNPAGIKLPENIDLSEVVKRIKSRKRALAADLEVVDATNLPPSASTTPESMSVVPAKMASIKLPQVMEFRDVDFLLFLEIKVRKLRESSYHPSYDVCHTLQSIIESRTELSNADRYAVLDAPQETLQTFQQEYYLTVNHQKLPNHCRRHWLAVDIFLSIELAKTLPVFEQLIYSDKEAFILNAVLSTAILTKSYYSYVRNSDAVIYPDGFMPVWLAKLDHEELNKLENEVFIRIIQPVKRINLTKEEYVLIKAIIFCNPACNNISDAGHRLLEQESERYSKTLLKYMQSIHGAAKGASRYAQVISIMEAMAYFAERNKEFHLINKMLKPRKPEFHDHAVNKVLHDILEK